MGALGGGSLVAEAQTMGPPMTVNTASYVMKLSIGPAAAIGSEVLVNPAANLSMTDMGRSVNHHIAVQILNRGTQGVATDLAPSILVTNQDTGEMRRYSVVPAMYAASVGATDYHYGVNVSLPDGLYTFTVTVVNEPAMFQNVQVSGGGVTSEPVPVTVPVSAAPPAVTVGSGGPLAPILPVGTDSTLDFANQSNQAQAMIAQAFARR